MTTPTEKKDGFARVKDDGSIRLRLQLECVGDALFESTNQAYLEALRDHINAAFSSRVRPLVEALKEINRATYGKTSASPIQCSAIARKALKEFRKVETHGK